MICVAIGNPTTAWFYTGALPKRLSTQLKAALRDAVITSAEPASIRALRLHGAVTLPLSAPASGTLTIEWREKRRGQHAATLIAAGQTSIGKSGEARIVIALTAAGKRLLQAAQHPHRLTPIAANAGFKIVGAKQIIVSKTFGLHS